MAKIKYDVRDVEPSRDFDKPIPVGVYNMKVSNAAKTKSNAGNDMLELELEVPKGDHKGRKVWEYIVLDESSEWKVRQLIDALGAELKGSLDTDKLIGETILCKIKHEPYNTTNEEGEDIVVITSKVASLLKPKSDAVEEEEESEEEPEGEEPEAEESEEEGLTWSDLQGYDRKQLKEFIKENEAEFKVMKSMSDDDIREGLASEFEVTIPSADEEEESEGTDYSGWALADLKKECKTRDLKTSGTKAALVKRLEEDDKKDKNDEEEPF